MKLHHSPIYQVTYGGGYFSHQTAELNYYLHDNCHDAHFDGDSIETAERIEIPRVELANLIAKICYNRREHEQWFKDNGINCTVDEMIIIISKWIAESDQRNDYVVLTWF